MVTLLGQMASKLAAGFQAVKTGFSESLYKYLFWIVFPGCWRSGSLPLWSSRSIYIAEWGTSKFLGVMSYLCLPQNPPSCSKSLRECRKGKELQFGVRAAPSMSYFSVQCQAGIPCVVLQARCYLGNFALFLWGRVLWASNVTLAPYLLRLCSYAFNHLALLDKWLLRIFPQNLRTCSPSRFLAAGYLWNVLRRQDREGHTNLP